MKMVLLLVLQGLAVLAIGAAFATLQKGLRVGGGGPLGRRTRRLPSPQAWLVVAALFLIGGIAVDLVLSSAVGGRRLAAALGGGAAVQRSDARAWLDARKAAPPAADDVGRNVRIVADGVPLLQAHQADLSSGVRARLDAWSHMPTRITRVLLRAEEKEYFQAAQEVWGAIEGLANR